MKKNCEAMAEELRLPVEEVKELLTKYSAEDIKKLHSKISESAADPYKKKDNIEESKKEETPNVSESKILGGSLAQRLNERLSK